MSRRDRLKKSLLALPPEERIELAEEMLLSVGSEHYAAVEAAWRIEVENRIRAYDEGRMKTYSLDEVKERFWKHIPENLRGGAN